jgi:NAD(P)-dependent dehydrogenase (short-subunit alcohol dehydrogenase family)
MVALISLKATAANRLNSYNLNRSPPGRCRNFGSFRSILAYILLPNRAGSASARFALRQLSTSLNVPTALFWNFVVGSLVFREPLEFLEITMQSAVALVTGAGSGIGKAAALALAGDGFAIGVLGHTRDAISATVEEVKRAGGQAIPLLADISDERHMPEAISLLATRFGRLNVVVANPGINGVWAPIDDLKLSEWNATISVNLTETFLTIRATVPELNRSGGGSMIVVSSIDGTRTFTTTGVTAYTATKAGQVAMVQQLALELARHHIRFNAVCPGEIETNIDANTSLRKEDETAIPVVWPEGQVPITGGGPGRSEDVADVIAFLASDNPRHVTGSPIWVDGGQGLLH